MFGFLKKRRGDDVPVNKNQVVAVADGKGFTVVGEAGAHVEAGTPIITFDPAVMREAGLDTTIPIVVLEDGGKEITMSYPEGAKAGRSVVMECK